MCVLQLGLHPGPAVLNRVEVWAVAWPVDQSDQGAYPIFIDRAEGKAADRLVWEITVDGLLVIRAAIISKFK